MEDFRDSQSQDGSSSERKSDSEANIFAAGFLPLANSAEASTHVDETVDAHDSLPPRTLPLKENDFLSVMPASVT